MNILAKELYADVAFLGPPGQPPIFEPDLLRQPVVSLVHLTSVSPLVNGFANVLSAHREFVKQTLSNPRLCRVGRGIDIESILGDDVGVLFGVQNPPKMTKADLRQLHDEGVQFMALVYTGRNKYGTAFDEPDGGLTERGKKLVEWMCEYNITLDLSYANYQTAHDTLNLIRQEQLPMRPMTSWTECYSVSPHPRSLRDDILEGVAEHGGYVGIPAIAFLIAREGELYLEKFVRHVMHAVELCGVDNVGVVPELPHFNTVVKKKLSKKFSPLAVEGFLGLNFMDFLIRSLP